MENDIIVIGEVLEHFGQVYVTMENQTMMSGQFLRATEIALEYGQMKITTCTEGWCCVEGDLSEADATAMDARLNEVFG